MRTFISCFIILLLSFGLFINEASAKRFGGGRSFGVQRSHNSLFKQNSTSHSSAYKQKANKSRWGGVLGGMLMGGLLASLFMGNGFANGIMTWLVLGAVVLFLVSFLRRRMQPGFQTAQSNVFRQNPVNQFTRPEQMGSGSSNNNDYSAHFSPEHFLRQAKVTFFRLQTAYDQKNLQDLKSFTAPEVFAEIQMQLDERSDAPNKTEVIKLEAQLLDVSKQALSTIASVRFTGSIKENNDPTTSLDEIWHFRQFETNGEWVVGGIQQEVVTPA